MAENSSEKLVQAGEHQALDKIAETAERRSEELRNKSERAPTIESAEAQQERAKIEALESAVSVEGGGAERQRNPASTPAPATKRSAPLSKKQLDDSFDDTMQEVRKDMRAPSRAFSKFIHAKPIEKASEAVGSTVARPNAILSGAVAAFIVTLGVYLVARYYGYPLSGFETILSFIIGWAIGLLFDYFRVLITGKTSA